MLYPAAKFAGPDTDATPICDSLKSPGRLGFFGSPHGSLLALRLLGEAISVPNCHAPAGDAHFCTRLDLVKEKGHFRGMEQGVVQ